MSYKARAVGFNMATSEKRFLSEIPIVTFYAWARDAADVHVTPKNALVKGPRPLPPEASLLQAPLKTPHAARNVVTAARTS